MADDKTHAAFRFDPARISTHEARRRMKAFKLGVEAEDHETGDRLIGTRSVTVTIPDIDLSELRRAAVSRLHSAGVSEAMIANYIGHKDTSTTRRTYLHIFDRDGQEALIAAAL
jgi:integrase